MPGDSIPFPPITPRASACASSRLSSFFFRSGTTRETGKTPMRSRDISFTACTALNRLTFFFLDAISDILP